MAEQRSRPGSTGAAFRTTLRRLLWILLTLISIVAIGTAGYVFIEGWSVRDAAYMTVITVSTVGYTEVRQLDGAGQLWTGVLIFSGLGTFAYATGSLVDLAVQGSVREYFKERRVKVDVGNLDGHYILCGFGRLGHEVAEDLAADDASFVVLERSEPRVKECRAAGFLAVQGDASDNDLLLQAGVQRAKGLIATVDSDAENVFVTLSARKLNPDLYIVARVNSDESVSKLETAGADRTISPYSVGARRLASLATRPSVVDFLDVVSRGEEGIEFRLEEFVVSKDSPLAGHTLGELDVAKKTGARILAIRNSGGFNTNPSAGDSITFGDTLVVLSTPEQVASLERLVED